MYYYYYSQIKLCEDKRCHLWETDGMKVNVSSTSSRDPLSEFIMKPSHSDNATCHVFPQQMANSRSFRARVDAGIEVEWWVIGHRDSTDVMTEKESLFPCRGWDVEIRNKSIICFLQKTIYIYINIFLRFYCMCYYWQWWRFHIDCWKVFLCII